MPKDDGRVSLSERAATGLLAMHRYRFLSIAQFAAASGLKPTFSGELLRDYERKKLLGSFGNVGIRGYGKTPKLYFLTRRGHDLLVADSGLPAETIGPYKLPHRGARWSPVMYHRLATIDLLLALEAALETRPHLCLVEVFLEYRRVRRNEVFVPETSDHVALAQTGANRIVPDAAFVIENAENGRRALFFLETDRGTERVHSRAGGYDLIGKCRKYERYLTGGRFAETYRRLGEFRFFTLLFATTVPARVARLREASEALAADLHPYFRLADFDAAQRDFLGPVWLSRDPADTALYPLVRS